MTYLERLKSYGPDKLRWEEAEEKIRLKQYVSLRSKGRHKCRSCAFKHLRWTRWKQYTMKLHILLKALVKIPYEVITAHILYTTSNMTRKNCFRYLKLMFPLNAAICTTISYTLWVEWYHLKNNYLTLRSKVKVPRKSLRYAIHHHIVMHPHTKYHWPIS